MGYCRITALSCKDKNGEVYEACPIWIVDIV